MRRFLLLSLLLLTAALLNATFSTAGEARPEQDVIRNIQTAIRAGSSKALSQYFQNSVEINIDGKEQNYSKSQAEYVLKNFFSSHRSTSFNYLHKGSSSKGLRYVIGNYEHSSGKYHVFLLIKEREGRQVVEKIDFSKY